MSHPRPCGLGRRLRAAGQVRKVPAEQAPVSRYGGLLNLRGPRGLCVAVFPQSFPLPLSKHIKFQMPPERLEQRIYLR